MEHLEYQQMANLEEEFWWYQALHEIVVDRIENSNPSEHQKVLDAGCGTGGFINYMTSEKKDFKIHGLELNPFAVSVAREKTGLAITQGDVLSIPFDNNQFDQVALVDVICHKKVDPVKVLSECCRCLKPGGSLHINTPAFNWLKSGHDERVHTSERHTVNSLANLIMQTPLKIEKIAYWNSLLFPVMIIQRLTVGKKSTSSEIKRIHPLLNSSLYGILSLERKLQNIGIFLPFGGSVWAWASKPKEGHAD
jgi:ubiquinone/menaquinone biosynthesis C-methylase UbiE